MLSIPQAGLANYWNEQQSHLISSIKEINELSRHYKRPKLWICKFIDSLVQIRAKPKISSQNIESLLAYLDLLAKTEIDNVDSRLELEKKFKTKTNQYLEVLKVNQPTRKDLQVLRELKRNLKLIAIQLFAKELLAEGDIEGFNTFRERYRMQFYIHDLNITKDISQSTNLSNCILENISLENKNFQNNNLANSKFISCTFNGGSFKKNSFENCNFENCTFNSLQFNSNKFTNCTFSNCQFSNLEGDKIDSKHRSLIKDSKFKSSQIRSSDLKGISISSSKFEDSDLDRVSFTSSYLKDIDFLKVNFRNTAFDYGNPQTQNINLIESSPNGFEFRNIDQDLELLLKRAAFLRQFNTLTSEAKRKFLLEHSTEFEDMPRKDLIKTFGISRQTLDQFDTKILRPDDNHQESNETLIQRLYIIKKIKDTVQSLVPTRNRKETHAKLCKLLYQTATNPSSKQKSQAQSIADEFRHIRSFQDENFTDIKDSIDEAIDYLLIPRIKSLYPEIDISKFNSKNLDQLTRYLQPYLAYAIIAPRDFGRIPQAAPYKGLSLLLNFSKDFHQQHVNFTGSIRDFAPQGGWRPILQTTSIEINGSDGRTYELINLLNANDFKQESEELGHCIGDSMTYVNKAKKGNYHYFSIRDKLTKKRISTLELQLITARNGVQQSRIPNTNFAFVILQNQGSVNNQRRAGIGNEITSKFLQDIQDGSIVIRTTNIEDLGDLRQRKKISNYENHIGTTLETDDKSDMDNLRRITRKAWARLARLNDIYLDRQFGNHQSSEEANYDKLTQKLTYAYRQAQVLKFMRARSNLYDIQSIETQSRLVKQAFEDIDGLIKIKDKPMPLAHEVISTVKSPAGIGSYNQSSTTPYDNYFIPNCFRGYFEGNSFHEFEDPANHDRDGVDIGLEKFYTEPIKDLGLSIDGLINKALRHYKLLA